MRLVSLAVVASLALAPGCAVLAVPPFVGATIGAIIADNSPPARHASAGDHAVAGGLIGLAIDVLLVLYVITNVPSGD